MQAWSVGSPKITFLYFIQNEYAGDVMHENVALVKSKKFAIRIVRLYQYLCDSKKEYIMSKQLLRCGTSIGANLSESESAISKKDFYAKVYIALKETSETKYWLELLHETDYLTHDEFESVYHDCIEIQKILNATTKTLAAQLHSLT